MTLKSSLFKEKFTSPLSLIFSTVIDDSGSWERSLRIRSQPNINLKWGGRVKRSNEEVNRVKERKSNGEGRLSRG